MFPGSLQVEKSIKWMKIIAILKFIFLKEKFRGMWWAGWLPVCCKSFLLLLYASRLCPCSSWISAPAEQHCKTLFSPEEIPRQYSSQHLRKENDFGHSYTCGSWILSLAGPLADQSSGEGELLLASLYFRQITSLYCLTSDFCLSCLNCQLFREVLYSTYCNRTIISSKASEHHSNINSKKAFIKAYKGNSLCFDLKHVKWVLENIPLKEQRIN